MQHLRDRNISDRLKKYQPVIFESMPEIDYGSAIFDDWMEEMIYYCRHGYQPKGMSKISGKYFWHLNFWPIKVGDISGKANARDVRKKVELPYYRDMDHLYFDFFEECQQDQVGMIVAKARDKGFSVNNTSIVGQEIVLYESNEVGVAAGLDSTTNDFRIKVSDGLQDIFYPLRPNFISDNEKLMKLGVEIKEGGTYLEYGQRSMAHYRTVANPNVFKGTRLKVMIFEEAGEITRLVEAYEASKPCFKDGSTQFGTPIVGGTGGKIEKESRDFKMMWEEHESFGLRKFFIDSTWVYSGCFDVYNGKSLRSKAKTIIMGEREVKEKNKSEKGQEALILHMQNYPLSEEDVFMQSQGNYWDTLALSKHKTLIENSSEYKSKLIYGRLEWDDSAYMSEIQELPNEYKTRYRMKHVPRVKWIDDPEGKMIKYKGPVVNEKGEQVFKELDLGGVDSYDQDQTGRKGSYGALVVYRRFANMDYEHNLPVFIYKERTRRSTMFYDNCLKVAIYYGLKLNIEYTNLNIFQYFDLNKANRYLLPKPGSILKKTSKAANQYGTRMTVDVKTEMEKIIAEELEINYKEIMFPDLLGDLIAWGNRNVDIGMAYGLAKLYHEKVKRDQIKEFEKHQEEKKKNYYRNLDGKIVYENPENHGTKHYVGNIILD